MHIFDGIKLAEQRELALKERIARDFFDKKLKIAAILFIEDAGSQVYTKLKGEAAERVGIEYEVYEFSLLESSSLESSSDNQTNSKVVAKIQELNSDPSITGIIIQKPWRKTWVKVQGDDFSQLVSQQDNSKKFERERYGFWWSSLTSEISEKKDVDGLHPNTIEQIKVGNWYKNNKVLPATCRAVLTILDREEGRGNFSSDKITDDKIVIIGKSDLLGVPLYYELLRRGEENVELIASKELRERMKSGQKLLDADIVISATGIKNLITGDMVSTGVIVIDVGEPSPDIDFSSVLPKASFITPVPGGVGPMTVVSLLENCADLAQ